MAASVNCYGKAFFHFQAGDIDWTTAAFKLGLFKNTYAPDRGNDEFLSDIVAHEAAAGGDYVAGGFALSGEAIAYDAPTRETRFDLTDLDPIVGPGDSFRYAVGYLATGVDATSILMYLLNLGADQTPGGLHYPIQWPGTGMFYGVAP